MSRRIDIELTSAREDGSWTWRAAGAREPRGTLDSAILPAGAAVGQVLRAEIEGQLDGISVVAVLPPKAPRAEPERLELKSSASAEHPLVTSTLAPRRSSERGRRNDRARDGDRGRDGGGRDSGGRDSGGRDSGRRERRGERGGDRGERGRDRQEGRHERSARPAPPPVEDKPKPKRLRPGKVHRTALLESVPAEQRPIAEQLLAGGIPAVRQAIDKQNEELKAAGKTEVKPDALLRVAEDLRGKASAAAWRDRAEAAAALVDELDLRDLRSVVNAAGDAGRDDESKALAAQLREALANRVEKEHSAWLAELADTVKAGRVVRALRLSSRPPKAGAPIPGDVATQLAEATAASLTSETGPDRWATVLDALAYSPVRRRVVPQSLPEKLNPELRATIARLATRLPEIAHIFAIEPDPGAERAARAASRRGGRKGDDRKGGDRGTGGKGRDRSRSGKGRGAPGSDKGVEKPTKSPAPEGQATPEPATEATPEPEPTPVATAETERTPEPSADAAPTAQAAADTAPEPAADPVAKAEPKAEPVTEAVAEAKPVATEPPAATEAKPVATEPPAATEAKPVATEPPAATEAKPVATEPPAVNEAKPEPVAEATTEPQANGAATVEDAAPEPAATPAEPASVGPRTSDEAAEANGTTPAVTADESEASADEVANR